MTSVEHQVTVQAPWELAFDVFTDFERFPEFMKSVDNVRPEEDDPAVTHWQVSIATVPRTFTTRTEIDREAHTVRWEAERGLRQRGSATFEPRDDGSTEITFRLEFEPEGALEKAGEASGMIGNRVRADLNHYVKYVESAGEHTAGHNTVADALDMNDPSQTPTERVTDRLYPGAR